MGLPPLLLPVAGRAHAACTASRAPEMGRQFSTATLARRPTREPSRGPLPTRGRRPRRSCRRSSRRPRRSCASSCACPARARSCLRPFHLNESGRPADMACWGGATLLSSHAGTSPTGDKRHSESSQALRPTARSESARRRSGPLPEPGHHRPSPNSTRERSTPPQGGRERATLLLERHRRRRAKDLPDTSATLTTRPTGVRPLSHYDPLARDGLAPCRTTDPVIGTLLGGAGDRREAYGVASSRARSS